MGYGSTAASSWQLQDDCVTQPLQSYGAPSLEPQLVGRELKRKLATLEEDGQALAAMAQATSRDGAKTSKKPPNVQQKRMVTRHWLAAKLHAMELEHQKCTDEAADDIQTLNKDVVQVSERGDELAKKEEIKTCITEIMARLDTKCKQPCDAKLAQSTTTPDASIESLGQLKQDVKHGPEIFKTCNSFAHLCDAVSEGHKLLNEVAKRAQTNMSMQLLTFLLAMMTWILVAKQCVLCASKPMAWSTLVLSCRVNSGGLRLRHCCIMMIPQLRPARCWPQSSSRSRANGLKST